MPVRLARQHGPLLPQRVRQMEPMHVDMSIKKVAHDLRLVNQKWAERK